MNEPTTWAIEREKAVELFGGTRPSDRDEQDIGRVFQKHPAAIITEIANIADAYDRGAIHSPWRVLHAKLNKLATDHQPTDPTHDREGAIRRAENWIRNAGIHAPTEAEVTHELFEARSSGYQRSSEALLAHWADDIELREHILNLWRQLRPLGEQLDREQLERAERWKTAQARLHSNPSP